MLIILTKLLDSDSIKVIFIEIEIYSENNKYEVIWGNLQMKKIMMITMIALAAAGMIGCGVEDETKADLRWWNDTGYTIKDVKWLNSNRQDEVTWDGELPDNTPNNHKGIKSLTGYADCVYPDGGLASITLAETSYTNGVNSEGYLSIGGDSATIVENAAATLAIDTITTK